MSKMNPYEYFTNFVVQNYEHWQEDPGSLFRAFNVAVPAFHLADNCFLYNRRHDGDFAKRYGEKDLPKFQAALSRRAKFFRTIQGMATAYKHLYTNVKCEVMSRGAVTAVTIGKQTFGSHYQHDANDETVSYIEIRRRDGSVVRFGEAIEQVVSMWRGIVVEGLALQ